VAFTGAVQEPRRSYEAERPSPVVEGDVPDGCRLFSTSGYQPGIPALAAGAVAPLATLVLLALNKALWTSPVMVDSWLRGTAHNRAGFYSPVLSVF
jgi:hypothetical protein